MICKVVKMASDFTLPAACFCAVLLAVAIFKILAHKKTISKFKRQNLKEEKKNKQFFKFPKEQYLYGSI
jgi:hypothetical protein